MLKRCWRSFSPRWRTTYRERPSSKWMKLCNSKTLAWQNQKCLREWLTTKIKPQYEIHRFHMERWDQCTNPMWIHLLTDLGLGLLSRNLTTDFGSQAISIFFNMERGHGSTQNACECTFLQFRVCGVLSRKSSKHIQWSPPQKLQEMIDRIKGLLHFCSFTQSGFCRETYRLTDKPVLTSPKSTPTLL